MKNYKRRGCLPFRFISRTKVGALRPKEVAIRFLRSIHPVKNGKEAVRRREQSGLRVGGSSEERVPSNEVGSE